MVRRINRIIWNSKTRTLVLWLLRFFPIHKGQVICASWAGAKNNCNPRAIVEEILRQEKASGIKRFQINYAFIDSEAHKLELPEGINVVEIGSLEYYYTIATSRFIIFNTRMSGIWFPYKKKHQIYIQTQHGGHGIKKVEFDAELPADYLKSAKIDTDRTDLMLSDSAYWTNVYRKGYYYDGEVLEKGLPRNDIFFSSAENVNEYKVKAIQYIHGKLKKDVGNLDCAKFLIYTPTFRANGRKDVYGFNTDKVISSLEKRFGGTWYVLVSSHPNMRDYYKEIYDFSHPRMIDMGNYPELQELLVFCDALITDYSSAEMDFSLTNRPVLQLVRDLAEYDRGTYLNPKKLPFPYAETDDELCRNIENFDNDKYQKELEDFNRNVIGLQETGHAAEAVVDWMNKHL